MVKHKISALLVLSFVLVPTVVLLADDPTSGFINPGPISTVIGGPASGAAVNAEIWNSAVNGTMLGTEPHIVDVDASGTITNDTGFGDFELGRGSGGVDATLFQNAAASPISRYLDVTQAGVSVLPGGNRIPFLTVPFALSVPLIHNFGNQNLFAGVNAGNFSLTGVANTGIGLNALSNDTTGNGNTASGKDALQSNTTGFFNTAVGFSALKNNTTGAFNTACGEAALGSNTTGDQNTASGYLALGRNTGRSNTANGANALFGNTTGGQNTASGTLALQLNTTGGGNTAIGFAAGVTTNPANANTTGSANTFIGLDAGPGTPTQLTNATAIGANALVNASNKIRLGNTAVTLIEGQGDFHASGPGNGIILKSPNGAVCRRLGIDDAGALVTTVVACP